MLSQNLTITNQLYNVTMSDERGSGMGAFGGELLMR